MIWQPVKANIGSGIVKVPPNRPTMTSRPPRPSARTPNCAEASAPTKSMAAPTPVPPVSSMICLRASLSRGSTAAQAPFSSASLRLPSSMSATIGSRPSTDLGEAHAHQADAAGADHQDRLAGVVADRLLDRAEGGDARAGIEAGELDRQVAVGIEILRMRHEHMVGVAAVLVDAERPRSRAEMLAAVAAVPALAAADPGIDHRLVADLRAPFGPLAASGPTATTSPTISWPMVRGGFMVFCGRELVAAAHVEDSLPTGGRRCGRRRRP